MNISKETLKSRSRIRSIFLENIKFSRFPITVLLRENEEGNALFLYCSQSKVKKAVLRNRLKRILRESVRTQWDYQLPVGFDICLIAHSDILKMKFKVRKVFFQNLFKDLSQWIQK